MGIAKKYKIIIFATLLLLLTSCTPQKRLIRLLNRHPYLAQNDTIYRDKPIITPGIELDTNFIFINGFNLSELPDIFFIPDTFIIKDEKISGTLIRQANQLKLNLNQKPDTLIIPVPEYRTIYKTQANEKHPNSLQIALIVAGIYSVLLVLIAIKKR